MPRQQTNNTNNKLNFRAYGVNVKIVYKDASITEQILKTIKYAIPNNLQIVEQTDCEHIFKVENEEKDKFSLEKNQEGEIIYDNSEKLLERLESNLRLTVAEHAESKVFIHAGVVELHGRAIIIPARSFKGKTTLVVELIKAGATYYSDEYAVLDENGLIYAFPKRLSVRGIIDDYTQLERPVDFYGGRTGSKPIRGGLILITEYKKNSHFKPKILSQGEAVLELISNTVPIRHKPDFSLKVLNKLADDAFAVKTKRGEAKRFAGNLINYFEKDLLRNS